MSAEKLNTEIKEPTNFNEQSKKLLVEIQSSLNKYLTPNVLNKLSDDESDLLAAHIDAIKLSILNLKSLSGEDENSELIFANLQLLEKSLKTALAQTKPNFNDKLEKVSSTINTPLETVKPTLNSIVAVVSAISAVLGGIVAIRNSYKDLKGD